MIRINESTLRSVLKNVRKRADKMKRDGDGFIEKRSEEVLRRTKNLVPVDEGELRDSGHIENVNGKPVIVYDAPHAIPVHEDRTASHDDGQAGFVSEEIQQEVSRFGRDAANAVKV